MTDHGIATDYSLFRRYDCSPRKSPAELHCISVTDSNGVPVTGLAAGNFEVDPLIVGPGGALVNIVGVSPGRLAGFYLLNVLPLRTETWKSGVYIFCVAVKRASDQETTAGKPRSQRRLLRARRAYRRYYQQQGQGCLKV
jgi:hypothetical protein